MAQYTGDASETAVGSFRLWDACTVQIKKLNHFVLLIEVISVLIFSPCIPAIPYVSPEIPGTISTNEIQGDPKKVITKNFAFGSFIYPPKKYLGNSDEQLFV